MKETKPQNRMTLPIKRLLSLPPNLVDHFHQLERVNPTQWYGTSDPLGTKLGSGGGTTWLLDACRKSEDESASFDTWIAQEKRILLHAGGQSRRLPAYAPSGKVLTPIPVFRWERGQRMEQNLLSVQLPLYDRILQYAPESLHTLVASGDVLLRATERLQPIPEVDVVCYGLWVEPSLAKNHGVFMMHRNRAEQLDYMLQKPSTEQLSQQMQTHFFLMDIGIWLLSDKAVKRLRQRSTDENGKVRNYDLYSDFGCALGTNPTQPDPLLQDLTVAILPLPGGEFYHFGTSHELLSSTTALQNLVKDQRFIIQKNIKRQPSVFTQNAIIHRKFEERNTNLWVENSYIPSSWIFSERNIVTGVPSNHFAVTLEPGICVDIVPLGDTDYVLRPYGFMDAFRGDLTKNETQYMEQPMPKWLAAHHVEISDCFRTDDLQAARLFPVCEDLDKLERLLTWMIDTAPVVDRSEEWRNSKRLSADELSDQANLVRLEAQRRSFRKENWPFIAANYEKSVFYQINLKHTAHEFVEMGIPLPAPLPESTPLLTRMRDAMFRSEVNRTLGKPFEAEESKAFALLREGLTDAMSNHKMLPKLHVYRDQIVWGRSSVRIDVAGGWSDTPPFSLSNGGNVVNLAIELNGQPPLQVYIKPSKEPEIICRSIDLGAMERITTYEELAAFNQVGSPFSIPKAAMCLVGFLPAFCRQRYASLREQLEDFGGGVEITLLSAIPAGSGLGTSSILASTVLGALSDFCGLDWDKNEICSQTLVLEQLLTTGGGWQDQYGGVLHGVKLIQSATGFGQYPSVRWLPDTLFNKGENRACHLLYYTGITRTAKSILAEIVRGMFLNETEHFAMLNEMKQHALEMYDTIQKGDFQYYGKLVRATWEQNKALDAGTSPARVEQLAARIDDLCLGYKLPGAGGGGYMYMVAKDPEAALRIRKELQQQPLTSSSRFVEMTLSDNGLQVSR
ncbi:MAG: bifunctional fucokinase/fucose-1-phosphate guanylyltransferase, partial [Bacteroidaceae bacterium]